MTKEYYYRLDNFLVSAGVDEWDNSLGAPPVHVCVFRYPVLSRTSKGVWIEYHGTQRFVLNESRKRFACSTLEQAKESFLARKARQKQILSLQLEDVDKAIESISTAIDLFLQAYPEAVS